MKEDFFPKKRRAPRQRGLRLAMRTGYAALVLVAFLSACATAPPEFGFRFDRDAQIYIDMGANRPPFEAGARMPDLSPVGAIYDKKEDIVSSTGTLIHPRWVLTAGHCIMDYEEDGSIFRYEAEDITFRFGADGAKPELEVGVKSIHVHPGFSGDLDYGNERGFDIALLELTESVAGIAPAVLPVEIADTPGQRVVAGGFGDYSEHLECESGVWSLRRAWENILDRALDTSAGGGLLAFDFDAPSTGQEETGPVNSLGRDFSTDDEELQRMIAVLGEGDSECRPLDYEGTSVPGDSGGPLFIKTEEGWKLAGITSFGTTDGTYGDIAFYTRVAAHMSWIREVLSSE